MRYDARNHEFHVQVLLHGPPAAGRRTNLAHLRDSLTGKRIRARAHGPVEYADIDLGSVMGHKVRARCITLPVGERWHRLRREALWDLSGVVFVADSVKEQADANKLAKEQLVEALAEYDYDLLALPHVYQWNKRDVRHPIPTSHLERDLNPEGVESVSAIAASGIGVWRTWRRVVELTVAAHMGEEGRSA